MDRGSVSEKRKAGWMMSEQRRLTELTKSGG